MSEKKAPNPNLGPLIWEEADKFLGPVQELQPTLEGLVDFLCGPDVPRDVERFRADYAAASEPETHNPIMRAPYKPQVLNRLILPLRHAKASFMLGNYLGTIALCGLVAEMAAIWLYEATGVHVKGQVMDAEKQRLIFGRPFEELGQDHRVKVLFGFGIIDDDIRREFDLARTIRKGHLHFFSKVPDDARGDALKIYASTLRVVFHIIGPDVMGRTDIHDTQIMRLMMAHARENRPIIVRPRSASTLEPPTEQE